jgi:hypothetical protein
MSHSHAAVKWFASSRGRYSLGVFIRGATFTKKLLQLFVGVAGGARSPPLAATRVVHSFVLVIRDVLRSSRVD